MKEINSVEVRKSEEQETPSLHSRGARMVNRYFSMEEIYQRHMIYVRKNNKSLFYSNLRRKAIDRYYEFLETINAKTLYKLNGNTLPKYLEYLKQQNIAVSTQEYWLKNLRVFYRWLYSEGIIKEKNQIFNGFQVSPYLRKLQRIYTPEQPEIIISPIRKEMNFYMEKFLDNYRNKGYTENGVKNNRFELRNFTNWLEDNTKITKLEQINKKLLTVFQEQVHKWKKKDCTLYSASHRQRRIMSVKMFFRYLTKFDYLEKDPATILEMPRRDRGLPTQIMSEEDLRKFLLLPDLKTARGLRDRTIMEVLYSTGVRLNELCHLKIEDINFGDELIRITMPKGGIKYQRVIPIGKIALDFIRKYLEKSRPELLKYQKDPDYLFLNNFGQQLKKQLLTKYMTHFWYKTKIQRKITTHSFRATCATDMLRNGADVRYIQEQLGHRSLLSTQIYTRVFPKDLKEVHKKTHPRKNLKI